MKGFYEALDHVLDRTVVFGYDRIGYHLRKNLWDDEEMDVDLRGRVALVTGANSGLGFETALGLARRNARVYLLCRNRERGERARTNIIGATGNSGVELAVVDLADLSAIRDFVTMFLKSEKRLDILVNNAGILPPERRETEDGLESTLAVNVIAPFLLTNLLLPALKKADAARIINISSGGMYLARLEVDDLQYAREEFDGTMAYARTKRAEILLTKIWAEELRDSGIIVTAMHPGWADTPAVQTSLPIFHAITRAVLRTPAEGADTILWLAVSPRIGLEQSGGFYFDRRPRPTHRLERTKNTADEIESFWNQCCDLSGLGRSAAGIDRAIFENVAASQ